MAYSLSSMVSTIVDYLIFIVAYALFPNVFFATFMGRLGSSLLNFSINKILVFKSMGNLKKQVVEYFILVIISGTLSAFLVNAIHELLQIKVVLIKIVVDSCIFLMNYYIQRSHIFKKHS